MTIVQRTSYSIQYSLSVQPDTMHLCLDKQCTEFRPFSHPQSDEATRFSQTNMQPSPFNFSIRICDHELLSAADQNIVEWYMNCFMVSKE